MNIRLCKAGHVVKNVRKMKEVSNVLKSVVKLDKKKGKKLEKGLREKRERQKKTRKRDGFGEAFYFKIFNIFSNSFITVRFLHFFGGYKI